MPNRPPSPCRAPLCPALVVGGGYCPAHKASGDRGQRRVSTWAWRKLRARKLKSDPLCETCLAAGRVRAATQVDHEVPVDQGGTDAWENLRSVCQPCHAKKTGAEATARARARRQGGNER